ncbi:MAG: flagellar basal body-associated FliL family protein [Candidatus Gastranaerophilales bacterium]|nr:flagellar basal body-associated FliL family protein [Candidatus Gastranaerophilales bacterium]
MAKPNAPKDIAPKKPNEENKDKGAGTKILIVNVLTTAIICGLFLAANYFIQDSMFKKISTDSTQETTTEADQEAAGEERGVIVDLGDFTMNLSDPDSRRYLKVSVALELTKTPADSEPAKKGGGHGEGAAASPLEEEMAQYKPAIRDAIISSLSSKTSAELSTTAGKELAKDEIIDAVDSIFGGEREVIRVSFGQFIMQ